MITSDMAQPLLLSVRDCCKLLHIGKMSIYRAIQNGDIGYVKIGRTYRIPLKELEKWTAKHTIKGGDNDNGKMDI